MSKNWAGLSGVEVVSGTAQDGPEEFRGFLTVRAIAEDGSFMTGQMSPAEVRKMALNLLAAAEGAVGDAIVMTMLVRDIGLEPAVAASFVMQMREERHRQDPDPDDVL